MNRFLLILQLFIIIISGCKKQTLEERLYQEAQQFTHKNCPKEIDKFTVMDSCTFSIPKRTYYYNYSVKGELDVDSLYTQSLYDRFRDQLLSDIKNSIQLKGCKDEGIILCYRYYSHRSGKLLMKQTFTKKDYK